MALRLVKRSTSRIDIGDEGDYIEVRDDISRRDFNTLLMTLPTDGITEGTVNFSVASGFSQGLFAAFVVGWSVTDEDGKAVEATVDNYNELSREAALLIDSAVSEHFNSLTPSSQEQDKSKESSD